MLTKNFQSINCNLSILQILNTCHRNLISAPVGCILCRKDPTNFTLTVHPGRLINHRKKRGRNLRPILLEINGHPEIFFKVDVDEIPSGKQICYDYGDNRNFCSSTNLHWLKNRDESSDDEGKAVVLLISLVLYVLLILVARISVYMTDICTQANSYFFITY